jgi:uncharacterized protein
MKRIRITVGDITGEAELLDSRTADAIWNALPIEAAARTWGEEIYFEIPVKCGEENPVALVREGDLAYWPPGRAFCIFFGPTPASKGEEIRPASPVNVVGQLAGDPKVFKAACSGDPVLIEYAEG